MRKPVSAYTDPSELRILMANAKRLGNDAVWREAFRRICTLEGLNYEDPLHRDFEAMLTAYEELLAIKNGRNTSAARTRQKLKNKGVIQCLEDWAKSYNSTQGFAMLLENGLPELTGEAIVLKYSSRFSEKAVTMARDRLKKHGINLELSDPETGQHNK
jgi:hypothetical protein